jgi:peptide/nickel transport system substrate-binding protein
MTKHIKNTSLLLRVFFLMFFVGLIGVFWQINTNFLVEIKASGGTIHEGIIGAPRFINPVLAQTQADIDLTRLVFTPILTIDRKGELHYLLADSIETAPDGLSYTLNMKRDLYFKDGVNITAHDVIFTIESIQDSLIKSPLATKWQGVSAERINQYTVTFKLARPFSDFLYNLELGILPKHIWDNIDPQEFIFSNYNTKPIGSGAYHVVDIENKETGVPSHYTLRSSPSSVEKPYVEKIILEFFNNEDEIVKALENNSIDAAYGVSPSVAEGINDPARIHSATLPRVFALFFNQESQPLLSSLKVREAIHYGTNTEALVEDIFAGYASPINSAFGFPTEESGFSTSKAEALLESEKWTKNEDGWYTKIIKDEEVALEFSVAIPNLEEMKAVAEHIRSNLAEIGIRLTIRSYDQGNFNQNILRPREYESIIFGYEIEKPSDMYAFWHSSQISDPGLNISLFKNSHVDTLLSSLRNTQNPEFKKIDTAIMSEYPAIFLYAPSYIYVLPEGVNDTSFSIARSSDRFNTIRDWYMRERKVWKMFTEE